VRVLLLRAGSVEVVPAKAHEDATRIRRFLISARR